MKNPFRRQWWEPDPKPLRNYIADCIELLRGVAFWSIALALPTFCLLYLIMMLEIGVP